MGSCILLIKCPFAPVESSLLAKVSLRNAKAKDGNIVAVVGKKGY